MVYSKISREASEQWNKLVADNELVEEEEEKKKTNSNNFRS